MYIHGQSWLTVKATTPTMEMTREATERLQKHQERLRKRQEGSADPRFRQQRLRKLSLRQRSRSPLSESQQRRDDRLSRRRERERKRRLRKQQRNERYAWGGIGRETELGGLLRLETESEEREVCLRRHRERDGARWASPTVDQTQARLEHNASYRHTHLQQLATNHQRRLESEMAEESYTRFFFFAISIFLPFIRSCNVCQPCAMDLSATDSSTMAWRSTQQWRIAAESTEEREARLHQLSVTQRQRIAAESTEEREARLQQLRILPNRNNHQDLLINCHSKYIPILLVLIDVFHYAIIEAFVMLFH